MIPNLSITQLSLVPALLTLGFAATIAFAQSETNPGIVTLTTLHSFTGADGANPGAPLVQANNGAFYGTTSLGGANCAASAYCGTIFKITPSGTLTTLYSFCSQSGCPDGPEPNGLVQATNGYFYGTTSGLYTNYNFGTIFKMTPSGMLTTVHTFCSEGVCTGGAYPRRVRCRLQMEIYMARRLPARSLGLL
jgi:uncharacterized repeat protein (TIGR03803 family)